MKVKLWKNIMVVCVWLAVFFIYLYIKKDISVLGNLSIFCAISGVCSGIIAWVIEKR